MLFIHLLLIEIYCCNRQIIVLIVYCIVIFVTFGIVVFSLF